jgi:hypothetical protein
MELAGVSDVMKRKGVSEYIQIQYTNQLPSNRLTMVIVDNELSLVIEEKKYEDPVGIAT